MACPSQPPCRFDTKVESQIIVSENPADSVNPENALSFVNFQNLERSRRNQIYRFRIVSNGQCTRASDYSNMSRFLLAYLASREPISIAIKRQKSLLDLIGADDKKIS